MERQRQYRRCGVILMRESAMTRSATLILALLLAAPLAPARVTGITIDGGMVAGTYAKTIGHFNGELDPADPLNRIINDIALAPRNARGRVEYTATFTLLTPIDSSRASGVLLCEVPNRGNSPLNTNSVQDAIAGGHTLLSSGWQGDLTPRAGLDTIEVPIAKNPDGSSITGPVIARISNQPDHASTASLSTGFAGLHYQWPATLDTSKALLTKQSSEDGEQIPIAASDWAFADCSKKPFPGEPDATKICLRNGFESNLLYQVVFTAKDPLVLGIGLAATCDLVSFFRHSPNPAHVSITHAIAFGTSQSGNFLKTFLNLGFNEDEDKRIVFDGMNPNIAGRQTPLNFRFAIPGGSAGLYEPGSEGVLWWSDYRDEARDRPTAGLLDRCRATNTCPKIIETFVSTELWELRMSPGLVGTRADTDIPLPSNVRRYYFPGVTHGGGRGGFQVIEPHTHGRICELPDNPNPSSDTMRALRQALIDWVVKGAAPPDSSYPTLAHADLVRPTRAAMGFPAIPGAPLPDNMMNTFLDCDFGPDFKSNDLSGAITIQHPTVRGTMPMLVPRTDADGNETSGIASVLHQAPLGTYLGWNVASSGYLKGRACGFSGGYIPFARTKAERLASGDPRPSLEERYGTHERYVERVRAAAGKLVKGRFLLPQDAGRLIREAEESAVLKQASRQPR
jgi:hypothetical protein